MEVKHRRRSKTKRVFLVVIIKLIVHSVSSNVLPPVVVILYQMQNTKFYKFDINKVDNNQ